MRILVVEDVRRLADDIAEGLRDHGMAVDVAYDGLGAAAKIDLNPYDVIVLDRDLPGVHGDTICRMVSERDNPAMVLMLTAADAPGDRVGGFMLGADDYLPKPFHFPELVVRIRALARRKPAAASRIYRAAGVELDPLRRKLGEPQVIQTIPGAGYRIADAPSPDRRPDAVSGGTGPTPRPSHGVPEPCRPPTPCRCRCSERERGGEALVSERFVSEGRLTSLHPKSTHPMTSWTQRSGVAT